MKESTIIITGCSKGIGRGLTTFFIKKGYQVAGIDIDYKEAKTLIDSLGQKENFHFFHGSVADESFIQETIDTLVDHKIIGLVNNAGISIPYSDPIEKLDLSTWQKYLDVNLTGAMLMIKYVVPQLRKTKGAIVNITSTRALQSEPNSECYAATKSGLIGLTHAAAISLGPAIRVNAVAPGWIDVTRHQGSQSQPYEFREKDINQHPTGSVGTPEDIAQAVDYLLSKRSAFMTGQVLTLDGGMTRKMIYED